MTFFHYDPWFIVFLQTWKYWFLREMVQNQFDEPVFGESMANLSRKYKHEVSWRGRYKSCLQITQKIETVAIQLMLQQLNNIIDHGPIAPKQKSFWKYYSGRKTTLQRKNAKNKHLLSESLTLNKQLFYWDTAQSHQLVFHKALCIMWTVIQLQIWGAII